MLRYLPVLFGAIGFPATLVLADATNGPSAAVTLRRLLSSGGTVFAATVDDFSSGAECTPYRIVPSSKGRGPYIVTKETKTAREGHDLALVVWPEGKAPLGQCNVQLIFLGSWSEDKRDKSNSGLSDMVSYCPEVMAKGSIDVNGERWFFRKDACSRYSRAAMGTMKSTREKK